MISFLILLLFTLFLSPAYQQSAPTKELTFCLTKATTSNTLRTFWRDVAHNDCELDAIRLIDQYTKLTHSEAKAGDSCHLLLIHQMRKKLIEIASQQLEETLIMQTLRENRNVNRLLEEIHTLDHRISERVWERALNDINAFVELATLVESILQMSNKEVQIFALDVLLSRNTINPLADAHMLPFVTFTLAKVLNASTLTSSALDNLRSAYYRLPQELRLLFAHQKVQAIGLLNRAHSEFLYAPRDNGPDGDKRLPLTWSKEKNSTDSDGHFQVELNDQGLVAFGSRFGDALKYLYADFESGAAYFWIGPGSKSGQWWKVVWLSDSQSCEGMHSIALQNDESKAYLCTAAEYDENRRYVILRSGPGSAGLHACQWLIREF